MHEPGLDRVREVHEVAVDLRALRRSDRRDEARVREAVGDVEHGCGGFRDEQVAVHEGGDAAVRIERQVLRRARPGVVALDEHELVVDAGLGEGRVGAMAAEVGM